MKNFFKKFMTKQHGAVGAHMDMHSGKVDRWLIASVVLLSLFGVLMVYDSSVAIAIRDFSDQYYFVKEQLKWLVVGLIALTVTSRIPYKMWYTIAVPLLVGTMALLLIVLLPGVGIHALGARRWINFGFFVLQPAEFAKLTLTIYLSAWFARGEKNRLPSFLLLAGMIVGLIMLEPDLGTSIILSGIAVSLYFFSGAPVMHFAGLFPIAAAGVLLLALATPYRMQRLTTFLNPENDPQGSSYQIRQALIGLGSGGWLGVGIGKSRQKYEYLPEANTDSIFAIIGEEIGFIGGAFIIIAFLFIISRGFRIAVRAPDTFGKLLALGITSWISVQSLVNISAMVALIPLTGVPLPFISYGGSSLIILLSAVGIVLNISRYRH